MLVLIACTRGPDPAPSSIGVDMMAMPADVLQECRRFVKLRPACPEVVPRTTRGDFARSFATKEGPELWVFFAEHGAPVEGTTERNAPPRYAHVNVLAGDPMNSRPDGEFRNWGGRQGLLIHVPEFPEGGMEAGHLIFRWSQNRTNYSISLHAWEPVAQAEGALRQMIESLP